MNITTDRPTIKPTDSKKYPSVSSYLVEWQIIVLFSIHGLGLVANILNHIVLKRGFSDTIMIHYIKCMNAVDATYCAINILGNTFEWWNYTHYKWLAEIYYYVILYGRFSLETLATLIFVPIAIDRIRASNRTKEEFAQKFVQNTTCTKKRIIFKVLNAGAIVISFICSLPLFYVFKIRNAYHEGNLVYTVMYVKPEQKQTKVYEYCSKCTRNQAGSLISQIDVEKLYFVTRNILPKAILCLCLIVFICKLAQIIIHYSYTKYCCEQEQEERSYLEDCKSDLSLVPAIVITIVLLSVVIITCGVITFLRDEKIIDPPRGMTMRKVVNMLLRKPVNLGCPIKPLIYLIFSARYGAYVVNVIKLKLCCRNNSSYEVS